MFVMGLKEPQDTSTIGRATAAISPVCLACRTIIIHNTRRALLVISMRGKEGHGAGSTNFGYHQQQRHTHKIATAHRSSSLNTKKKKGDSGFERLFAQPRELQTSIRKGLGKDRRKYIDRSRGGFRHPCVFLLTLEISSFVLTNQIKVLPFPSCNCFLHFFLVSNMSSRAQVER